MPPDLPGEMTDLIIGSVPMEDKETLRSCSLVCRAWLPASRHRLFTEFEIRNKRTYGLLVDRVLHSDDMRPYLATATRKVLLDTTDWCDSTRRPLPGAFLHLFYRSFPRLVYLSLVGANASLFHRSTDALLFSQFTSLRCLHIYFSTFPSFVTLRRMVDSLRGLEELDVRDVAVLHRSGQTAAQQSTLPQALSRNACYGPKLCAFRAIYWNRPSTDNEVYCLDALMGWLLSTAAAAKLEVLYFCVASLQASSNPIFDPMLAPGCILFFQVAGPSVSSLTLDVVGGLSPISYFTSLSDLHLIGSLHSEPSSWEHVCSMLHELQSRLRHLHLFNIVHHGSDGDDRRPHTERCMCLLPSAGATAFDAALTRDIFKDLVQVELSLRRTCLHAERGKADSGWPPHPSLDPSEVLALTKASLPQLHARGIISVGAEQWTHISRAPRRAPDTPPASQSVPIPNAQE